MTDASRRRVRILLVVVTVAALAAAGCGRRKADDRLARVGDAELTLGEALAAIDTTRVPYDDQLRSYVARWVNDELLYQAARSAGLDRDDDVVRRVRDARRRLVVEAFLRKETMSDTAVPPEPVLEEYFRAHAAEFIAREQIIRLNIVAFSTRERAAAFSTLVARGTPWGTAVDAIVRDTAASTRLLANVSGQFYSEHTLFPAELWKVAAALGVNEVSFPVKGSEGFSVLQPLASVPQGKPAPFAFVRDEVRRRIAVERRRRLVDELLGTLRAQVAVEIVPGAGISDTVQISRHE